MDKSLKGIHYTTASAFTDTEREQDKPDISSEEYDMIRNIVQNKDIQQRNGHRRL